jgi:murein endopeptidase
MSLFTALSLVYALLGIPQLERSVQQTYTQLEEKVLFTAGIQRIDFEPIFIYVGQEGLEKKAENWPRNSTLIPSNQYINATRSNRYAWPELVDMLVGAAGEMFERYKVEGVGPRLQVNDASRRRGGKLYPHLSHRRGIDVDVGMYRCHQGHCENRAESIKEWNPETLKANWEFLKSVQDHYPIQYIFWNGRYINAMKGYVLSNYGEEEWEYYGKVFHSDRSHTKHFHIRIRDPREVKREQQKVSGPCC